MLKMILKLLLNLNQIYKPSSCLPSHCFCEAMGKGLIRQPINAYTNIGYILVGIFIALRLLKNRNLKKYSSLASKLSRKIFIIFPFALLAVGLGSFMYHAGFTFLEQEFDEDSMYLIGSFLLLFSLSKLRKISANQFLISYIILNLALEILFYFVPVIRPLLFGILILGTILLEATAFKKKVKNGDLKYLFYGLALFLLAFIFWFFDYTKIICYPNSYLQGHSIWHILSALAVLMMYLFMESVYKKEVIAN